MRNLREKRVKRIRKKLSSGVNHPRLSVFRSNRHIYAQIINDQEGRTLISASEKEVKEGRGNKVEMAKKVGELIAQRAKNKKIMKVVFDRGGYKYHGRVRALAEAARKGGLQF